MIGHSGRRQSTVVTRDSLTGWPPYWSTTIHYGEKKKSTHTSTRTARNSLQRASQTSTKTSVKYSAGQVLNSPRRENPYTHDLEVTPRTHHAMSEVVYITLEPSQPTRVDGVPTQHWIHPHLIESHDPVKGRQFRASDLIPKGACLLADRPYAIIPVVDEPAVNDQLICSNPACNRPAPRHAGRCSCPNACIPDVVWCSSACRDTDRLRHEFECTWLKRYAGSIRAKWGEYDFGMLWVIVRLLATRSREEQQQKCSPGQDLTSYPPKGKHGWDGINSLCGSTETWSNDQVRSWATLVKKYLQNSSILPHGMTAERILHLICQEEANSFGLYPRETGVFPSPNPPIDRGEQFAAAVYPTAAIANHSCLPNVRVHSPPESRFLCSFESRLFINPILKVAWSLLHPAVYAQAKNVAFPTST